MFDTFLQGFHGMDETTHALGAFEHGWDHAPMPDPHHTPVFDPWAPADVPHDPAHPPAIGTPDGDGFTAQTTGFTCNVVSQKMILDQFGVADPHTGQPVSEAQLVYDATVHGWLTDHGTSIPDMGRLLEYYGIPCHHGSGFEGMMRELADGHQVIVAVNADPLWNKHWQAVPDSGPNHALVLKGVKADGHGGLVVVLNDPGSPNGAGVEYPLDQFRAACDDSGFHYIATDAAAPGCQAAHLPAHFAPTAAPSGYGYHDPDPFADFVNHLTPAEKHDFLRHL